MAFCAPCLYCCVSNAQKVDIVMSQLGSVNTINRLETDESPQLVCGRVLPVKEDFFIAPAINKACVYYQTVVEVLVDKTESNMMEGQADDNDRVWISKCIETRAADFCLVDPAFPDLKVYIPGGHFKLKARALEDDLNGKADGTALVLNEHNLTPEIQDLFHRNSFAIGKMPLNRIRIREASFEYAEQVVALGIVKDVTDPTTQKINKIMFPLEKAALTDKYFEDKHIAGWTKQSLLDVCNEPCIIVSSDETHFKGVNVGKLKRKMVCAEYVDIQHVLSTGVNNIDRQLE